ncbi:zinc finger, RAN binding protein, putative [Plasmodium berghei]|uniref:Zinc finger Ran-binding domain-containing protein 2 n=2 Tax=Plasmodium berghei TaxID=5821 RepID=A0A509AKJ5_PLABA|nr:zinc finger Ran-binding domain-containing protein 2, putative [Plasmodium berghei ANKA]CXI49591.1 zinc finger, RAN binding protein, putative [Plasmodium berghei]SCL94056.1 zinc finger, RAN binding protein, putative [Plasmodium berghei]SCM15934.1 zinc finger, RAN binding protein, putative [Plasmodium berghei]SCM17730.1 zinc finger, RAN binding protein, putative [Plasmodium berghei]SCN25908.1 zinc finger, RAN binding protein, putative [Plasmodium berghei]|eukprot:XP_034421859.1 zinc finger Ran-binding domain-containing protein 2, putative [Plasmodium berghei ANKA]
MEDHKYSDKRDSEDWICTDEKCRNVNSYKRMYCIQCNRVRPKKTIKKNPKQILFKTNDWKCDDCGNINWAKREKCNICGKSKYTKKINDFKPNKEIRTGKGGGHYDIQGNNERRAHDSEDEEFDEFGRRKKRKLPNNEGNDSKTQTGNSSTRNYNNYSNNKDIANKNYAHKKRRTSSHSRSDSINSYKNSRENSYSNDDDKKTKNYKYGSKKYDNNSKDNYKHNDKKYDNKKKHNHSSKYNDNKYDEDKSDDSRKNNYYIKGYRKD